MLAGTGAAAWLHSAVWWKALLALAVSISLIVGVNYANDYSDGIRGTDDDRAGPLRLVGSAGGVPRAVLYGGRNEPGPGCGRRGDPGTVERSVADRRRGLISRRLALHRGLPAVRLP